MFLRSPPSTEINPCTIQFQAAGRGSRSREENSRDQTPASMMRVFSLRRDLNTFLKLLPFMVINHFTTPCPVDGVVNRSQADNLRDLILALMTRLFWVKRDPNMSQKLHRWMETNLSTIQFQPDGPDNKFQEDSSRDPTLVSMMKLFSERKATNIERSEYKNCVHLICEVQFAIRLLLYLRIMVV